MKPILAPLVRKIRQALGRLRTARPSAVDASAIAEPPADPPLSGAPTDWHRARRPALAVLAVATAGVGLWALASHPPVHHVARGEIAQRTNLFSGEVTRWRDGSLLVLPGLHEVRSLSLRDQTWRAASMARADGPAPAQSVEGLSVGLELSVRWAIDADKLASSLGKGISEDPATDVVAPAVQGVVYRELAGHTVREIFSTQRAEIQRRIESELRGRLATEGLLLRSVQIGNIDLPADYRRGLDSLLAEGLATEKMRYTLELKDKRVKETELDAAADKVRRETAAEAAGREQVIAAKAQEEAMKHVLPFKQRQVEQRQLEAEAERQARVRTAEGSAQARRIEAEGEAEARRKLADAEAYRLARVGKANAEQMAAEGALITRHPLLIQKTLADRLSDKIQVIIAPAPESGGFIGSALVGALKTGNADPARPAEGRDASQEQ